LTNNTTYQICVFETEPKDLRVVESADRHEVSGTSVDAGGVAKLGDLVNESDDEMGAKRLREPAERLHGRGMLPALDARDRGVAGSHALREFGLAQLQLTPAAYNDPRQRLIRREPL
jgi:hypothetical protein